MLLLIFWDYKLQQKTYVVEAKVFAEAIMTCMQVLEKRSGPQICGQRVMTYMVSLSLDKEKHQKCTARLLDLLNQSLACFICFLINGV